MSHDYANQTPCGRHTYKRTLCFPSIAKLNFHANNSETRQRNKEEKLSQYNSKNGGNATIQRHRWRKELLECYKSSITPIARRSRGTPKTKSQDGAIARFEEKRHSRNCCQTFEGNLWFSTNPNSKDSRCESKWHKLNTKGTKPQQIADVFILFCFWRDKFSFADVRVMYIEMMSGFETDLHWIKCTKPSRIEKEKRKEEFAQGMP